MTVHQFPPGGRWRLPARDAALGLTLPGTGCSAEVIILPVIRIERHVFVEKIKQRTTRRKPPRGKK